MRELIRLSGVSFRYRGSSRQILSDVSLTVREGDRILLRGASGCGKSTLLQILAGLAPEYVTGDLSGAVELLYGAKGVVLQNPEAQIVTPTVGEEVAFALENAGVARDEIRFRVDSALASLGLSALAARHPLTLSGGECQRVSLAAALVQEPDILFLDEPTSFLDDESSERFFDALNLLPERSAVIVVEHKIRTAERICTKSFEVTEAGGLAASDFREETALPRVAPVPNRSDATSAAALELRDAGCRIRPGGPFLFQGVSFSVQAGEVAALMGPSGCGKTTLLETIAGIRGRESGAILFGGRDAFVLKRNAFNKAFMYIPQNPEHMFVAESVRAELDISGMGALASARRFGLEHCLSSSPFRLSEGEKRRLNISVALAEDRPVYLMDEPTYGLDGANRALLIRDVRSLADTGAAVLFVTHDTEFADHVADRLFRMEGGTVVEKECGDADAYKSA